MKNERLPPVHFPLKAYRGYWQARTFVKCSSLLTLFLLMPALIPAQTLKPDKVFLPETLCRKHITSAYIILKNDQGLPEKETYTFDTLGNYTGFFKSEGNHVDTQYLQVFEKGMIRELKERSKGRDLDVKLEYDTTGLLLRKFNLIDDTLYSLVSYCYDSAGRMIASCEQLSSGDTLSEAHYCYSQGKLTGITYQGLEIGKIQYTSKGRKLTTRVYNPASELMMTRRERYRNDGLLLHETLTVTGIRAFSATRYRYWSGLLWKIILPEGTRVRVKYERVH